MSGEVVKSAYMITGGGFAMALMQLSIVYYVGCVVVHFVFPRMASPTLPLSKQKAESKQIMREAAQSFIVLIVKALLFVVVEKLFEYKLSKLHNDPFIVDQLHWQIPSVIATVVALDCVGDTWFYFTHLRMHKWRWLYKHVHYLHHQSKVQTAFSGYCLHPLEAVIIFFDLIIVCFLFPIHINVHRLYHLNVILIHIGGHAGYELHPYIHSLEQLVWILFRGSSVSQRLNTVLYHDMHHQFPNKNFSLYFTHWDEWFGTKRMGYNEELLRIKEAKCIALAKAKKSSLVHYLSLSIITCGALIFACSVYALLYPLI